jgi:arsenical pump membrane protein
MNNLPVGLIAGSAVQGNHVSDQVRRAILIGVDPRPQSVGHRFARDDLAVPRASRERQVMGRFAFGALIMRPAMLLAVGAAVLLP